MTVKRDGLKWVLASIRRAVGVLGVLLSVGGAASAQVPTPTAPTSSPLRAPQQRAPNAHEQQIVSWIHYGKFAGACSLYRVVEYSGLVYAACGDAGLWLIRGGPPPMLVEARSLGGRVVNVYE